MILRIKREKVNRSRSVGGWQRRSRLIGREKGKRGMPNYENRVTRRKKLWARLFSTRNRSDMVTWLALTSPLFVSLLIIVLWVLAVASVGDGNLGVEDHLVISLALLVVGIGGIIQVIRKETPGRFFNIIRGRAAIVRGIFQFMVSFGSSLLFLWLAFSGQNIP
jgi:hypothetical protein